MNLKRILLSSAATIAAIASLSHTKNTSWASEMNLTATDTIAQTQPEDTAGRINILQYMRVGKATYELNNPSMKFAYDPNFMVATLVEEYNDSSPSEPIGALVRSIVLWTKQDYLTLENAGDEVGDFPPRVRISAHSNPEGLPLQDWITTYPFFPKLENVRKLDTMVAGQEAWGFSHTPIVKYDSIAFKDDQGRVIVLHDWVPTRDDSVSSYVTINDNHYSSAFSSLLESIELTAADQ